MTLEIQPEIILALTLSGVSLLVSIFIAGWTVYRDAIQKPKFKVSINVKSVARSNLPHVGPDIHVDALNLGPITNRIGVVFVSPSWFSMRILRKPMAFVISDHNHIANTAKGQRVEVGDSATFVFSLDADFANGNYVKIGVSDGFGRMHWAKRSKFKKAKKAIADTRKRVAAK